MSALELAAVVTSALSVYLGTRQNIWIWPVGLLSVALYALFFYELKLYADACLQVFYFAAQVYGWWAWLHGAGGGALRVARTPMAWLLGLFAGGAAFSWALGAWFSAHTDAALPYLDSTLSAFSVVAQWQMTRKWIENWLLWVVLDVVYVGMFVFKQVYPTAALYAGFLVLAALGYREWRRDLRAGPAL